MFKSIIDHSGRLRGLFESPDVCILCLPWLKPLAPPYGKTLTVLGLAGHTTCPDVERRMSSGLHGYGGEKITVFEQKPYAA